VRSADQVSGMICIRPIAPLGEMARASPALSAAMTACIHAAGTPKRRAASAMWSAIVWSR